MKNGQAEAEARIREVVAMLDRARSELSEMGIDVPASYASMAHDLLADRLVSLRARPFGRAPSPRT